jgi:hypothetical protein
MPILTPIAVNLLELLLDFDPEARISVEGALAHPYLEAYHDPADEPAHTDVFDFSFEVLESIDDMKSNQKLPFLTWRRTDCTGNLLLQGQERGEEEVLVW